MPEHRSGLAVTGATLIDGTGGPPRPKTTVITEGQSIAAVVPDGSVSLPTGAKVIDAAGKFVIPGLVDTNVHLAPFKRVEELLLYRHQYADIALETAQLLLKAGVTTGRDSYGFLNPLLETRDAIAEGRAPGPRLLVAGNIVGWGGFRSMTVDPRGLHIAVPEAPDLIDASASYPLQVLQDEMTQGVGEELIAMGPTEVGEAIARYLDKGVDFVKYGGTTHKLTPSLILFSPRVQEAIVDVVHARGKAVETHCTSSEALRISVLAGIDLIQHPEMLDAPMTDELLQLIVDRGVNCSINFDAITGEVWNDYQVMVEERELARPVPSRPLTGLERRLRGYWRHREWWRTNAQRLIHAGCLITTPSDTAALLPTSVMPEASRPATGYSNSPGRSTLMSIEGAVELGLTPMEAIVGATRNGAVACKSLDEYGTVEQGKSADMVVLDRNPLDDIHNIESVRHVVARGQLVDRDALPQNPVYYDRL